MKKCSKCGQAKELDQFGRFARSTDGHASACKECVRTQRVIGRTLNRAEWPVGWSYVLCRAGVGSLSIDEDGVRIELAETRKRWTREIWTENAGRMFMTDNGVSLDDTNAILSRLTSILKAR